MGETKIDMENRDPKDMNSHIQVQNELDAYTNSIEMLSKT